LQGKKEKETENCPRLHAIATTAFPLFRSDKCNDVADSVGTSRQWTSIMTKALMHPVNIRESLIVKKVF